MDFSSIMDANSWVFLTNPSAWIALLTLTFLEIVLGIDNIVFLSIVSGKLPEKDQPKARTVGLFLAMIFRIILLFSISFIVQMKEGLLDEPICFLNMTFNPSGQSLIVFAGGIFLLYKAVSEIHHKLEGVEGHTTQTGKNKLVAAIIQIVMLDIVFSFDSVITAIGIIPLEPVDAVPPGFGYMGGMILMITAVLISITTMMIFAGPVSKFVNEHPTIQILGLSFLILIGFMLILEGLHDAHFAMGDAHAQAIPKGYLYFAIFFSLTVEFLNMRMRKKGSKPVDLHFSDIRDENLK